MSKEIKKPIKKELTAKEELAEYEEGQYGTEKLSYENQEEMDAWLEELNSKIPFEKR